MHAYHDGGISEAGDAKGNKKKEVLL